MQTRECIRQDREFKRENTFKKAGFRDIQCMRVAAPLKLSSAAECVRFEQDSFGALHQMLSGLDGQGKAGAWEEIVEQLRQFEQDAVFEVPCELVVGVVTALNGAKMD